MIKLDDNLLAEMGLGALQKEEKTAFLRHMYETLELRVGTRLAERMSEQQMSEFEQFINANDEQGAFTWLESNFPNYKDVVAEEFEKLKAEVRPLVPQILASAPPPPASATGAQAQQLQPQPLSQQPQVAPSVTPTPTPYQQPTTQQFSSDEYVGSASASTASAPIYPPVPSFPTQQPMAAPMNPAPVFDQSAPFPPASDPALAQAPAPVQQMPAQPFYGTPQDSTNAYVSTTPPPPAPYQFQQPMTPSSTPMNDMPLPPQQPMPQPQQPLTQTPPPYPPMSDANGDANPFMNGINPPYPPQQ